MTNSKWRIGDFYFPVNEEPDRVDIKTVRSTKVGSINEFIPYIQLWNIGYKPTNIVFQAVQKDFTTGSTGDWGLEKLKAEAQRNKEVIVELENFDSTNNLRRYYGLISDFNYNMSGNRPALFDYRVSIDCAIPFCFRGGSAGLEYAENASVGTSETTVDLGTHDFTAETDLMFRYYNDTGSAITELIIGETSTTTGNYITVTGSLANGSSWLIYPIKYNNQTNVYGIRTVWTINADTANDLDLMSINAKDSGVTTSSASIEVTGNWVQILGANQDIKAKATGAAGGNLLVQWRDIL